MMKIKQTIRNVVTGGLLGAALITSLAPYSTTFAQTCPNGGDPSNNCSVVGTSPGGGTTPDTTAAQAKGNNGCEVDTAIINCNNVDTSADGVENTGLWSLLLTGINILTAGIGVVALGGLIYGAILYTSAGGSPEQVKKARTIFTNVVIGIVAYAGMWALLNFIIPGGVL